MKKSILYIIVFSLVFSSCKTTKNNTSTRMLSARKLIKAHYKASFDKNTVKAKLKVHFSNKNTSQTLNIKLRIKKDEVIWMSGTFLGIPVAKVKITPTSVQYYEKIKHTYFDGDFSLISNTLGTELDFFQLQNILLGEAIFNLKETKFSSALDGQVHVLTPKKQEELFAIFYWINPIHYKLDKQRIEKQTNEQYLSISYPEYQEISKVLFPKKVNIKVSDHTKNTTIEMEIKSIVFDKKLNFPFKIPDGYQRINL